MQTPPGAASAHGIARALAAQNIAPCMTATRVGSSASNAGAFAFARASGVSCGLAGAVGVGVDGVEEAGGGGIDGASAGSVIGDGDGDGDSDRENASNAATDRLPTAREITRRA